MLRNSATHDTLDFIGSLYDPLACSGASQPQCAVCQSPECALVNHHGLVVAPFSVTERDGLFKVVGFPVEWQASGSESHLVCRFFESRASGRLRSPKF